MYGEKMKLKDDKRRLIIKGKEGKDYRMSYLFVSVQTDTDEIC